MVGVCQKANSRRKRTENFWIRVERPIQPYHTVSSSGIEFDYETHWLKVSAFSVALMLQQYCAITAQPLRQQRTDTAQPLRQNLFPKRCTAVI